LGVIDEVLVAAVDGQAPEAEGSDGWLAREGEEEGGVGGEVVGAEGWAVPAWVEGDVGNELGLGQRS